MKGRSIVIIGAGVAIGTGLAKLLQDENIVVTDQTVSELRTTTEVSQAVLEFKACSKKVMYDSLLSWRYIGEPEFDDREVQPTLQDGTVVELILRQRFLRKEPPDI